MRRFYTAEDDGFLIETHATLSVAEQARHLGRSYKAVSERRRILTAQGQIDPTRRAVLRLWSSDDAVLVELMLQRGSSLTFVARKIGRSVSAIRHYLKRNSKTVTEYRAADNVRTAIDVARLFGVHPSSVPRWIRRGWLRARHNKAQRNDRKRKKGAAQYLITDDDITAFVERRDAWFAWEPRHITDRDWREFAEECRTATGERWLTATEIAERWHYSPTTIRGYCRMGKVPGVLYGRTYYVWSADVAAKEIREAA